MNQQYTFKPMSKEELRPMLPPGEYKYEVYGAEIKMSKSDNPQIVLKLKVFSPGGTSVFVDDFLLLPNPDKHDDEWIRKYTWKLRNFSHSCKLEKEYESGKFNEIADNAFNKATKKGKTGMAKVIIERGSEYRGNDGQLKMGFDKNRITSYIETEGQSQLAFVTTGQESMKYNATSQNTIPLADEFGDSIPF